MPLRSSRFYLFGYLHYYGHFRHPQTAVGYSALLGPPMFMRYLRYARNTILPRIASGVLPFRCTCFPPFYLQSSRLHHLWQTGHYQFRVTRPNWCSLHICSIVSFCTFVSSGTITMASTWTANWVVWFFHPHRYLFCLFIYIYARFMAHLRHEDSQRWGLKA